MNLERLFRFREPPNDDGQGAVKPFLDHLEDLRWMIIKIAIAIGLAMVASFAFRQQLVDIVQAPLASVDEELVRRLASLGVADSMTISLQLAFYAGFVFAFPAVLYFLAEFVLPALTRRERKVLFVAAGVGFGLFLTGVAFSYFVVLPQTLAFFYKDAATLGWSPNWTVREYYAFCTQFTIAFGLAFELPVVVLALVKIGILDRRALGRFRPYAVVCIFVFAAIITPTQDMVTLVLMGGPMCLLYEACIFIARFMERKDQRPNSGM